MIGRLTPEELAREMERQAALTREALRREHREYMRAYRARNPEHTRALGRAQARRHRARLKAAKRQESLI